MFAKWNYLAAMAASNPDNYLSYEMIDNPDLENGDEVVDMTPYSLDNPEQILLKKEKWANLREESKQVIELILNCPREIMVEILGTRKRSNRNRLTAKKVANYLYKCWGDREFVDDVINEIREYVRG